MGTDRKEKGGDHEINVSKNSLIKFSHDKTCKKSAAKYNLEKLEIDKLEK